MKIYTRNGDDGYTSLSGGSRIPKTNIRIEACGSLDELTAWIGLLRDLKENRDRKDDLIFIQGQLMKSISCLSSYPASETSSKLIPETDTLTFIEKKIDIMEESLQPVKNFIIPGGNIAVSYCNIARCICRRAERELLRLNETEPTPEIINKIINRLSDYLFILMRKISLEIDNEEVMWKM